MSTEIVNGNGIDALKASFRPFRIEIETESGERLSVWAKPMGFDFWGEKRQKTAIEARLKAEGVEGEDLQGAIVSGMLCQFLKDHLVKPPADAEAGFRRDEQPELLFDQADDVPTVLSYRAMIGIRTAIQTKGLVVVQEAGIKN